MISGRAADIGRFNDLMPFPQNVEERKYKKGDTQDIINVIMYADKQSGPYTTEVAPMFQKGTYKATAECIWNFIHNNIKYIADTPGHERVKSPAKTWHDGYGDCKSFSIMAGSILKNLGIPYKYRFVAYEEDSDYTHVYIIVRGGHILDAVHTKFNEELPYSRKKDIKPMTKVSYVHGVQSSMRIGQKESGPAPVQPYYNFFAMTDGELRVALLRENLELQKYGTGDPTGEYEEAIELIDQVGGDLHYIDRTIKSPSASKVSGYIARQINIARQKRKGGGKFFPFIRGNRPEWAGQGDGPWPENWTTAWQRKGSIFRDPAPGFGTGWGPNAGKVYWKGKVYDSWDHLFMANDFDCHYDLASGSNSPWPSNNKGRKNRDVVRGQCKLVKAYMNDLNQKFERIAPQYIYNFAGPITGKTYLVTNKMQAHKVAIQTIGYYGSISIDNMVLWTRNGCVRQALQYADGPVSPEDQIKIIKSGAGPDHIGEPITVLGLTIVQLIGIITTASTIALEFLKRNDIKALEQGMYQPSLKANSASPNDWKSEGGLNNSILPLGLLAGGALLLTT